MGSPVCCRALPYCREIRAIAVHVVLGEQLVRIQTPSPCSLKVLDLVKNIVADDRVQFHVLTAVDPLPISPSDSQALGYQLLRQTIQSIFPEVSTVVPGNDFISCGWREVGAGSVFLSNVSCPTSTPAVQPGNIWLPPLVMRLELYFPLGVEVRKQTGKEQKQ